jgi:hypothetical protein
LQKLHSANPSDVFEKYFQTSLFLFIGGILIPNLNNQENLL